MNKFKILRGIYRFYNVYYPKTYAEKETMRSQAEFIYNTTEIEDLIRIYGEFKI